MNPVLMDANPIAIITEIVATLAQWQSKRFVSVRLWVQLPQVALSQTPAAFCRWAFVLMQDQ